MTSEPKGLRSLQTQFARAMSAPIVIDPRTGDYELSVQRYPAPLVADMQPRHGMSGVQRLGVYNQQYWFRLLTVLQEEYPLLVALLGLVSFNRMGVAYLAAHPSRSPLLRHLSDPLCGWLQEDHEWNRADVRQCAELEHHYIVAFDARHVPVLDPSAVPAQRLLTEPLSLQPHVCLFVEDFDLVRHRALVYADRTVAVQLRDTRSWWAIHRRHGLQAEPLEPLQYRLLDLIACGSSLQVACDTVLADATEAQAAHLASHIQGWFSRWMQLGWFCADGVH